MTSHAWCSVAVAAYAANAARDKAQTKELTATAREGRRLHAPAAVREQLHQSVSHSVGHPAYKPVHGWVQAHSSFAYAWCLVRGVWPGTVHVRLSTSLLSTTA